MRTWIELNRNVKAGYGYGMRQGSVEQEMEGVVTARGSDFATERKGAGGIVVEGW